MVCKSCCLGLAFFFFLDHTVLKQKYLARSDGLDTAISTAFLGHIRIHLTVLTAHFSYRVQWLPVWVGTAAAVTWHAASVDANVFVVKVGQTVFPVHPDGVVKSGVRPDCAEFHRVISVTHAQVSFLWNSVTGAVDASIRHQVPSVFLGVTVDHVTVVHFNAFVASREFSAQVIDSVLSWSLAARDLRQTGKAMATVVLNHFGNVV